MSQEEDPLLPGAGPGEEGGGAGVSAAAPTKSHMCLEALIDVNKVAKAYLGVTKDIQMPKESNPILKKVTDLGDQIDKVTEFMDALEVSMDAKMGIKRVKVSDKIAHVNGEECSVMVRDARAQKNMDNVPAPHELSESYRIISAGRVRGALYLIQQCTGDNQYYAAQEVMKIMNAFDDVLKHPDSVAQGPQLIKHLDHKLLEVLKGRGLKLAGEDLAGVAQQSYTDSIDLANLTEKEHPTVISISADVTNGQVASTEAGSATRKPLYKVTANVPVRPFSDSGELLQNQDWYSNMGSQRSVLVEPVRERLNDGMHQKPTQLGTFIGGVSNFSYQTSCFVDSSGTEVGGDDTRYGVLRSGTVVFGRGKAEGGMVQDETSRNIKYKQELGTKAIHVLNHESGITDVLDAQDQPIVKGAISVGTRKRADFANRGERVKGRGDEIVQSDGYENEECKSGKDRTGLQVMEADLASTENIAKELGFDSLNAKKIMQHTYDTAIIAGGSGCTRGIFAINGKGTMSGLGNTARIAEKSTAKYITSSQKQAELNHSDSPESAPPALYKQHQKNSDQFNRQVTAKNAADQVAAIVSDLISQDVAGGARPPHAKNSQKLRGGSGIKQPLLGGITEI